MDASTALLILAAVAPYLMWLFRFIMRSLIHSNSHVDHGAINKKELSIIESSASTSAPVPAPAPYPPSSSKEELSIVESNASTSSLAPYLPSVTEYDVFLSFRGEDTRRNFTSHLHDALRRASIETFLDDDRLERGGEISPSLQKAIEESGIFVIIFSKDYASSTWCLDELVKILECNKRDDRFVIPVFHNIDPSTVRKQSGSYADAFLKHEKRFMGNQDKVQEWKNALSQAANLAGWDSATFRDESELIRKIVDDILKKLSRVSSCNVDGLVGIGEHKAKIEELLRIGSLDVRVVGIWGMAGIGKTTIAEVVFDSVKAQFESSHFARDVRGQLAGEGLQSLQNKCLEELLGKGCGTHNIKSTFVTSRLGRKKILLVLDGVDDPIHGKDLISISSYVGKGSRIIITSRNKRVLINAVAQETYHVEGMNRYDALHLFSLNVFKNNQPKKDYAELITRVVDYSKGNPYDALHLSSLNALMENQPKKDYVELITRAVDYCGGNPLALIVLASSLKDKNEEEWRSVLAKLEAVQHDHIFNVLKISFDSLDEAQKDIFLDLACFFCIYGDANFQEISNFYESPEVNIGVLVERTLISLDDDDDGGRYIVMHDLVRTMGQKVSQQLKKIPGEPIRLWKREDIRRALRNKAEIKRIRSITVNLSEEEIAVHRTASRNMHNLRFLQVYRFYGKDSLGLHMPEGLENFPDELRILEWKDCPLRSLPLTLCAENLVELVMQNSRLERLWEGDLSLPNLKEIDLSNSPHLIELPNLSEAPNIEWLALSGCVSLARLYSSDSLYKLWLVNLDNCNKLMTMELAAIKCRTLSWKGCPLPSLPSNFYSKSLEFLNLTGSHVEKLWDGDQHLPSLQAITLHNCGQLTRLPDLSQAPNIEWLVLNGCSRLVQAYSSGFLYRLKMIDLRCCEKLRSLHLARNIHRRSSVLVACYNYFDIHNFSLIKVNLSLLVASPNNKLVLSLKVVSVPYTEISECMDSVQSAELQLLGKTLASSLPYLSFLRWLHFPSSIGQFSQQFKLIPSYDSETKYTDLELLRTSSEILEPAESLMLYPCIKESAIKEVSLPMEELIDSENLTESCATGSNKLFRVPCDMGCFLFIAELTLQKSDIVSAPVIIPGFSSLISLAACDCKSQALIMDLSILEDSKEGMSIYYSHESTDIDIGFRAFQISLQLEKSLLIDSF